MTKAIDVLEEQLDLLRERIEELREEEKELTDAIEQLRGKKKPVPNFDYPSNQEQANQMFLNRMNRKQ
jgi:predicted  nucleic acid-binding Zn-ribbon protein